MIMYTGEMKVNKRINKDVISFCKQCKKIQPLEKFYGYNRTCCKKCVTKKNNLHHVNNPSWDDYHKKYRQKQSQKYNFNWSSFHLRAIYYCKSYDLYPDICPICGYHRKIQLHHPFYREYNDRKLVVFCCSGCHLDIHNKKIECPEPIDLKLLHESKKHDGKYQ